VEWNNIPVSDGIPLWATTLDWSAPYKAHDPDHADTEEVTEFTEKTLSGVLASFALLKIGYHLLPESGASFRLT
jgi:hypothetical protein